MKVLYEDSRGRTVVQFDGSVWWESFISGRAELLAGSDDVCGIGLFETGPDDPLRDACVWHDHAYTNRAFFEERGWTRSTIDLHFLSLMKIAAKGDPLLLARAYDFYVIVRAVAWMFYYRHPGFVTRTK